MRVVSVSATRQDRCFVRDRTGGDGEGCAVRSPRIRPRPDARVGGAGDVGTGGSSQVREETGRQGASGVVCRGSQRYKERSPTDTPALVHLSCEPGDHSAAGSAVVARPRARDDCRSGDGHSAGQEAVCDLEVVHDGVTLNRAAAGQRVVWSGDVQRVGHEGSSLVREDLLCGVGEGEQGRYPGASGRQLPDQLVAVDQWHGSLLISTPQTGDTRSLPAHPRPRVSASN